MDEARAYCPASLSLIFKACPDKNPLKTGSVGVGFTVDKKVSVQVKSAVKNRVIFNGKEISFPTVLTVLEKFKKTAEVSITSSLPLGFGFGISGASALATSFATNKLFALNKSPLELAGIAHLAEIENKTGLGSVGTQLTGGFLVKNKPGIPVDATSLPFVGKKLYVVIIDRLETPTILRSQYLLREINKFADLALEKIRKMENITLEEVIDISYIYAKKSRLISNKKVISIIHKIKENKGHATMAMLGNVIITDIRPYFIKNFRVEELTIVD